MNPTFHLNAIGICLLDFSAGTQFYTDQLGIIPAEISADSPDRLLLLDGWRSTAPAQASNEISDFKSRRAARKKKGNFAMPGGKTRSARKAKPSRQKVVVRGMQVELFAADLAEGWQDSDFQSSGRLSLFASLQDVSPFTDSIMGQIEGPEGLVWQVWQEDGQVEPWKARGIRMNCKEVQTQLDFYSQAFGWRVLSSDENSGKLLQGDGMPTLDLKKDESVAPIKLPDGTAALRNIPTWMSVETNDLAAASAQFESSGLTILQAQSPLPQGGQAIVLADAEGNPVRVTQSN